MKTAIATLAVILSSVVLSSAALAEVKPAGTFVPRQCSTEHVISTFGRGQTVLPFSVCLGDIVGSEGSMVQIRFSETEVELYKVLDMTLIGGTADTHQYELSLESLAADKVGQPADLVMSVSTQDRHIVDLEGTLAGEHTLHARNFEFMVTTMDMDLDSTSGIDDVADTSKTFNDKDLDKAVSSVQNWKHLPATK